MAHAVKESKLIISTFLHIEIDALFGTALSSWFSGRIRGAVPNAAESREVILGWFWEVILWNKLRSWELKKLASPNSEKWLSILILKNYHKESKKITFSHRITSQENQGELGARAVPNGAWIHPNICISNYNSIILFFASLLIYYNKFWQRYYPSFWCLKRHLFVTAGFIIFV
jgi:hypothetical protein